MKNKSLILRPWHHKALFMLLMVLCITCHGEAQTSAADEEISIFVSLPKIGGREVPAILRGEVLYLSVADLFNFLKINNTSASPGEIKGFFIDMHRQYLVDAEHYRIRYDDQVIQLSPDGLIRTGTAIYLRVDHFGKIFGLDCHFDFRSLSVSLSTQLEIPVIREMQREMMRRNVKKLKGDVQADTVVRRRYPLLSVGMADWSVVSTQQVKSHEATRFGLRLGGIVAGGEADVTLNYNNEVPLSKSRQFYRWRFVNNRLRLFRQVMAGHIATMATSSILSPVRGVQITNTPTYNRKSFGTYTLSDHTEPSWMVELYINNVLVDYKRADASGFYSFQIPLLYGNNLVKTRFYGPSGEEKESEQHISIPFTFLPAKTFEYNVAAGIVQDSLNSRFAKAGLYYGLSNRFTLSGGMEYLSSVTAGKSMPFLAATLRVSSGFLVSAEYNHNVRAKATISYRRPSNFQLELNYLKYAKGQRAINNNFLEERKLTATLPFRLGNITLFSRAALNQVVVPTVGRETVMAMKYNDLPKRKYTSAEMMLSGTLSRFSANMTTYAQFAKSRPLNIYSNAFFAYRLQRNITLRSQFQLSYDRGRLMTMKYDIEKRLGSKGLVNFSYERNALTRTNNFLAGFRCNLSFIRASFAANRTGEKTIFTQSANGSLIYDRYERYFKAENNPRVGKGGITLVSFLDINGNTRRDKGEPGITGLRFRINGAQYIPTKESHVTRVDNLEPYTHYLIELDGNSFGNIAWQIKKKNISVSVDPNHFKLIEIPVAVMNEVSGMVVVQKGNEKKGQSRIQVNFYDTSHQKIAQTLSEGDGYFSYMGLRPGRYYVSIDSGQLKTLNLTCTPSQLSFNITTSQDGVVADGFEMVLQSPLDTIAKHQNTSEQSAIKSKNTLLKPASEKMKLQEKKTPPLIKPRRAKKQTTVAKGSPASMKPRSAPHKRISTSPTKTGDDPDRQQLITKAAALGKRHVKAYESAKRLIAEQKKLKEDKRKLEKEVNQLKDDIDLLKKQIEDLRRRVK